MNNFTMKAELHVHSNMRIKSPLLPFFYESTESAEDIVRTVVKKGIRVLAITDHDSLHGYREAKRFAGKEKISVILVPGCEITAKEGHILAYGIKKEIQKGLSAEETIREVHKQGGIAIAAHPYANVLLSRKTKGVGNRIFTLHVDGIEGLNAFTGKKENLKAAAAAKKLGLPCIAGSDAHMTEDIGKGVTVFPKGTRNCGDVIRSIKQGNFRASCAQANIIVAGLRHVYKNVELRLAGN